MRRGAFGNYYVGLAAYSKILFNRFVKKGSDDQYVVQADANSMVLGGVEIDNRLYYRDMSERDGWAANEAIPVKATGEVVIKVGSGGVTKGSYVKPDANGCAVAYTFPTASDTYAKAEVQAAIDQRKIVCGIALETVAENGLCRILLVH